MEFSVSQKYLNIIFSDKLFITLNVDIKGFQLYIN